MDDEQIELLINSVGCEVVEMLQHEQKVDYKYYVPTGHYYASSYMYLSSGYKVKLVWPIYDN